MKRKNTLTKEEIYHLAKLSNLILTDEELEKYQKQLEDTVRYIDNLNQLDTKNTSPISQSTNLTDVFFNDGEANRRLLTQEDALKNAKNKKNGYFIVKRIL